MLRGMFPRALYPYAILLALAPTAACSDDKPKSAEPQKTTGDESFKSRVDSAHEDFKKDIQPAAGWVDDRSHEVADEANRAVDKGKKAVSGDDDHDHDHDSK